MVAKYFINAVSMPRWQNVSLISLNNRPTLVFIIMIDKSKNSVSEVTVRPSFLMRDRWLSVVVL